MRNLERIPARSPPPRSGWRGAYGLAIDVLEAVFTARVVVFVVVGVWLGLADIPQAVDSLVTLGQNNRSGAWVGVAASTAWLAVSAWFWSRLVLNPDGQPGKARLRRLRAALPRLLGAASFVAVANGLVRAASGVPHGMVDAMGSHVSGAGPLRWAATGLSALAVLFLALTSTRLAARLRGWHLPRRFVLVVTLTIAALGMAAYGTAPLLTAELVPPLPTILFAAAGLICGGVALARLGARWHVPLLAFVILGASVLAVLRDRSLLPDNHDLSVLAPPAQRRPDLAEALAAFLAANGGQGGEVPVVLVATGGGGLAAADFTATVLGDIADASPALAQHIFAISGVSGGALGAAEFVRAQTERADCRLPSLRACLQAALDADFLGPIIGAGLYSDLLQRFLPAVVFPDREAAIEAAWASRWRATFGTDTLLAPLLDAWTPGHPWPALLLNGTSVRSGGRLVTSNLDLGGALTGDGQDLLGVLGGDLSLAEAVGASSRFPYVAPLGVVRRRGGTIDDWVVDGGYFESTGATTALDILQALQALKPARRLRFVVVQIVSDPQTKPSEVPLGSLLPRGLAGPASALLRSRGARGVYAIQALARGTVAAGGTYVSIRLGSSPMGSSAPLGWSLSHTAQGIIDAQWSPACREELLSAAGFAGRARPVSTARVAGVSRQCPVLSY